MEEAGGEEAVRKYDEILSQLATNKQALDLVPHMSAMVASEIRSVKTDCTEAIQSLTTNLRKRSRFRKTIVESIASVKGRHFTVSEIEDIADVCRGYVKGMKHKHKHEKYKYRPTPLFNEAIRGFESDSRDSVAAEEVSAIVEWAREEMNVRSGTHTQTFCLETHKQTLLQNFNAAYPRILRQVYSDNNSLRATIYTKNMTIFHRNMERACWLATQPGFEEGDKADEEELVRLKEKLASGWTRGKMPKCKLSEFQPEGWVIVNRSPEWFWEIIKKEGLRFRLMRKPYECVVCLSTPDEELHVVNSLLAEAEVDSKFGDDHTPRVVLSAEKREELETKKRKLMKKCWKKKVHQRQLDNQRDYNKTHLNAILRADTGICLVTIDFGASYFIDGSKFIMLVMFLKYADEMGHFHMECVYNIVSDRDQISEDAHCVVMMWDWHLKPSGSGVFDNFRKIIVPRDGGPHFQNNNVCYFESTIYAKYGKLFEVSAFAKHHGWSSCDAAIARMVETVREKSMIAPPTDAATAAACINDHPKFLNATAYFWDIIDRSPEVFPADLVKFKGIKDQQFCQFVYAYTDHDGEVKREPGYVMARPLSGVGEWTFHDFLSKQRPKEWGKRCARCSDRHRRPIFHKREGEPVLICQKPVSRPLRQPDTSHVDRSRQPLPKRQQKLLAQRQSKWTGKVRCSVCSREFKDNRGLGNHARSKHPGNDEAKVGVPIQHEQPVSEQPAAAPAQSQPLQLVQGARDVEPVAISDSEEEEDSTDTDGAHGVDGDGDKMYEPSEIIEEKWELDTESGNQELWYKVYWEPRSLYPDPEWHHYSVLYHCTTIKREWNRKKAQLKKTRLENQRKKGRGKGRRK